MAYGWLQTGSCFHRLSAVAVALAIGAGGGWYLASATADETPDEIGKAAVDRFYQAISGKVPIDDVLGEAFQLMRTNGSRFDRQAYIDRAASLQDYHLDDFKVTQSGDVMTVTFFAGLSGTVGDVQRDSTSDPRLAVFTRIDGDWKLQAFANLGQGMATGIDTTARAAVETWISAVASGDSDRLRAVLAPEFQILRADGSAHDAETYLAGGAAKIDAVLAIEDLVATGFGDYIVARYTLAADSSVDGKAMQTKAPRLTVFRHYGDAWLVVSHANFASPET